VIKEITPIDSACRRPDALLGRVWKRLNDGYWLIFLIKQPWHTKYCQLCFEGFFNRKYLQLPTCLPSTV